MSDYYTPKRTRNMYDPKSEKSFKISRSKIEQFMNCPRCFYIDRRLGVSQPPGFPFNLNSAVDTLLKREFDEFRFKRQPHPLMEKFGIQGIPFEHMDLNKWRDALRGGISYLHQDTNLLVTGGIDDVWIDKDGWLNIVDYKATSKNGEVSLDADWQIGYKRQMEMYQWLFRQNKFKVSDTGYFVYCNGNSSSERFDSKLNFDIKVIPYSGNDSWVEDYLFKIKDTLNQDAVPAHSESCDYCAYQRAVSEVTTNANSKSYSGLNL